MLLDDQKLYSDSNGNNELTPHIYILDISLLCLVLNLAGSTRPWRIFAAVFMSHVHELGSNLCSELLVDE